MFFSIIISFFSMHNGKINAWTFCVVTQLIHPFSFFLFVQKKESSGLPKHCGTHKGLLSNSIRPSHIDLFQVWSLVLRIKQVFTFCFFSSVKRTFCMQSGKCDIMLEKISLLTFAYSLALPGYPSLTLFFWEQTINGTVSAYIFLSETYRDCTTLVSVISLIKTFWP